MIIWRFVSISCVRSWGLSNRIPPGNPFFNGLSGCGETPTQAKETKQNLDFEQCAGKLPKHALATLRSSEYSTGGGVHTFASVEYSPNLYKQILESDLPQAVFKDRGAQLLPAEPAKLAEVLQRRYEVG